MMRLVKTNSPVIDETKILNHDLIQELMSSMINKIDKALEEHIVEGLCRKGFNFKNRHELKVFIKSRCRCECNLDLKERVYYVDNIPFFLYSYESEVSSGLPIKGMEYRMTLNSGTYHYL